MSREMCSLSSGMKADFPELKESSGMSLALHSGDIRSRSSSRLALHPVNAQSIRVWFTGHGGVWSEVGFDDPGGLFSL